MTSDSQFSFTENILEPWVDEEEDDELRRLTSDIRTLATVQREVAGMVDSLQQELDHTEDSVTAIKQDTDEAVTFLGEAMKEKKKRSKVKWSVSGTAALGVAGAVVGGPVGAAVGASAGAYLGCKVAKGVNKSQIKRLDSILAEHSSEKFDQSSETSLQDDERESPAAGVVGSTDQTQESQHNRLEPSHGLLSSPRVPRSPRQ
uniref:t-SNARE coiled-coil homology domain-containing protein n=1 Tax=Noctiluca scintillans TaxID=2966 RepID=A0A7S1A4Q8_NOCSC|mmetsp:Transcript_31003/g.82394  ORF Transcript_31003/g.82394 Transcript_31003/m.82394 type:complete len:203 (+) Transcript_31003:42-650(+)